ncbi:GNAT family N-acetyltransferase [Chondrinema litorale]|uniref:GNAT family N-acetyltransferase n=1 Tax=Chondrinema litorale TaxID=2994555 RepID=UPI0025434586|nr:GNAT family N-acetyltransferase [Chondrinema litorale]UZR94789.1 GNAT family N-acetyltransferase [Chondrinema litorale]
MQIRQATKADISAISQLFKETILHVNKKDYNERQVIIWASGYDDYEKWKSKIADQYFILAEVAGEVAGFTSITKKGYLDYMFVSHLHQGKGVATALVQAIEDYAFQNKMSEITSDVSITAKPFFISKGFAVIKEQEVLLKGVYFTNYKMNKRLT